MLLAKEGNADSNQSTASDEEDKTPKEQQKLRSVNELEALLQEREEQIKQQSETVGETQVRVHQSFLHDCTVILYKLPFNYFTFIISQNKYLRALAETENVRQRMTKQVEEAKLYGIQGFSKDILEVADTLEKATESVPKEELEEHVNPPLSALYDGLKLTEAELQKVFSKNGLKKIDGVGENFDPNFHEALFELPGEKHGTVAVVSRVGYMLHGRTIRAAKVGVVKAPDTS